MNAGVHASNSGVAKKLSGEDKRSGVIEISFNLANSEGVNIYSRRDDDADFKFLARDTVPPYVDNRPMLVAGEPEQHFQVPQRPWPIASQVNGAIRLVQED